MLLLISNVTIINELKTKLYGLESFSENDRNFGHKYLLNWKGHGLDNFGHDFVF